MTGEVVVSVVVELGEIAQAYTLRHAVFVLEQGVPVELERDDRDSTADHVLATLKGQPVGAGRLVIEATGFQGMDPARGPVGHLGRLAVLAEGRGRGVGALMVAAIEAQAAERGLRCVYLGAQTHAVAFYERLGYSVFGDEFEDAGLPHRHMWRRVGPADY